MPKSLKISNKFKVKLFESTKRKKRKKTAETKKRELTNKFDITWTCEQKGVREEINTNRNISNRRTEKKDNRLEIIRKEYCETTLTALT